MRKILAFLIVFSVFSTVFADNIDGFYKIKFGMNEDQVKTIMEGLDFSLDQKELFKNNVIVVSFEPLKNFRVFSNDVVSIVCTFYSDKLVDVSFLFLKCDVKKIFENVINKYPNLNLVLRDPDTHLMKFIDCETNNFLDFKVTEIESYFFVNISLYVNTENYDFFNN